MAGPDENSLLLSLKLAVDVLVGNRELMRYLHICISLILKSCGLVLGNSFFPFANWLLLHGTQFVFFWFIIFSS